MLKGSILFDINKKINLETLDSYVKSLTGFQHWEERATKRGFSGLEADVVDVDGVKYNRILIVWTDDGKNGYVRNDLTQNQIDRIKQVLENYSG